MAGCTGMHDTNTDIPVLSNDKVRSSAISVPYDAVFKSIEQYKGKIVHITGEVLQVQNAGSGYVIRVATVPSSYGSYYDGIYWVNYDGSSGRILEKDFVDIYGYVNGLKTYEAILGNQNTIPEITTYIIQSKEKPDPSKNLVLTITSLKNEGEYLTHNVARGTLQNTASRAISYGSVRVKFLAEENGPVIATSSDYISSLGPNEVFEWKVENYKDADRVQYVTAEVDSARF